ncbi:HNH endonuclease [Bacillus phage JBP901]|uniref:Putative HNH endonuclease n=2 Tax=Caeruleovirus TaxID=1911929 RepID=A0A0E3DES5_9CAUD|nr:HNH endonuclease [Bacillus phage JBP901]YP_009149681.1 HNH endonuclease [Bacillus phage BCP8-2]AHJ87158.1 putative HNH endonuclease [Bacillus phage BCP8-2]AID17793.1 putative HNH endonuclease [Bacillus phage JBP901]
MEQWKSLNGIVENGENYEVSDLGRVKHARKGNILRHTSSSGGYCQVGLCGSGKLKKYVIHRLVALAFIPNPENKPQVNHIDGNKQNNCLSNLEWVTVSENIIHAINTGLNPINTQMDEKVAVSIKKAYISGKTVQDIIKEFNLTKGTVINTLREKRWKHVKVEGFTPYPSNDPKLNSTKITESDVRKIRELFATGNHNHNQIAEIMGMKRSNISKIINGSTWKHVEVEGFIPCKRDDELSNAAKISIEDVRKIRELYASGKYNHRQVAELMNMNRRNVSNIINRKTWKHVD